MQFFTLIPYYFSWHYTTAFVNFFGIWGNFLWFTYNYFSISILLRTLFSPFKRLSENYRGGLEIGKWFESLIVNTLMRIVGLVIRTAVIIFGAAVFTLVFLIGVAIFFVWLVLPFVLIFFFVSGLAALFR